MLFRSAMKAASSYLGELDTIVWACKRTKAFRGDIPLIIKTDNHGIIDKFKASNVYDQDIRSFRRWSWIIANEPGVQVEFLPGAENCGADLLSRPIKKVEGKTSKREKEVKMIQVREDDLLATVEVKKMSKIAVLPVKGSTDAAGFDLYGIEDRKSVV